MKARDESRDETDWEGYEIKEGAMTWAKVNPRQTVATKWGKYKGNLPFSLEAYTDSDDDYIEMQAYNSVTYLAAQCSARLFVRLNSAFCPPLSPLTRHHLSPPTARM